MKIEITNVRPQDTHNPDYDRAMIEHENRRAEWGRVQAEGQESYVHLRAQYDRARAEHDAWTARQAEDSETAGSEPFVPDEPQPPQSKKPPVLPNVTPTITKLRIEFVTDTGYEGAVYVSEEEGQDKDSVKAAINKAVEKMIPAAVAAGDSFSI